MTPAERTVELLVELHEGLSRLGPGDTGSTLRALSLCEQLAATPEILDVGCGTGAQTLDLAAALDCRITAVDLFPRFLSRLRADARRRGLAGRIRAVQADMQDLPFDDASFDLIWSEGAVYNMGFDEALTGWRRLLRPGGYLVVSEVSWFRSSPPTELAAHWAEHYPAIRSVEQNLAAAEQLGWHAVGNFHLPVSAWTRAYYGPLRERLPEFRAAHADEAEAQAVADTTEQEMALVDRFSDWFGYEFFALRVSR